LWDLCGFCDKYEHLYICGAGERQEMLLKFFDMCGIAVEGYTVTCPEEQNLKYRSLPIVAVDELIKRPGVGIVMGVADYNYRFFIPKFRKAGFSDYFVITEYSKNTIIAQITPRPIEEMTFEVSLADHCNLSCQMCDHYSQLSSKWFVDMDTFERDMKRMGKIFNHTIGAVTLIGGEPTLHKDIVRCMEITRREFPDGEVIILTNGILLPKLENSPRGNIWEACKRLDVHITVTVYPLKFDYAALEKKAKEYGVVLSMSSNIHADELTKLTKISDKHTFDLTGQAETTGFVSCAYFNKFNALREGRYYMCPVAAHVNIFNDYFRQNLTLAEADSLDIYKVESWEELSEFTAKRCPFCGYCDLKKWRNHSQWTVSSNNIDEYVDI
jgi:MoaA/NifB/PqqE/SkfB family radical SAM enzyme